MDKLSYHQQFSARYKTKDFTDDDINPWLSKSPRKNKILEMLTQSTLVKQLNSNFTKVPLAGGPVNYSNWVPVDQRT